VRAIEKDLAFEVLSHTALPATVQTDPTRLRQILLNLANNAVKFTEQGVVRLIAGVTAPDDQGRRHMQFQVIDSGRGMREHELEQLFQPFRQVDGSATRQKGGTGLGLSISKHLTQMLGGDIVVDSQLGRGTMFTVTLDPGPLDEVDWIEQPEQEATVEDAGRSKTTGESSFESLSGHVLLAEDGQHNRELLKLFLQQAGLTVTEASNGRVALEAVQQAEAEGPGFDLALMDMQMPEMDGYAATRAIRARTTQLPIVALTAHAMTGDRRQCLEAGCDGYLSKPVKRQTLLSTVAQYLPDAGAQAAGSANDKADPVPAEAERPNTADDANGAGSSEQSQAGLRSSEADDEAVAALLEQFVADLPRRVHQLQQALQQQDREALRSVTHDVKGTAGTYGFEPVAKVAEHLQQQLETDEAFDGLTEQVHHLIGVIEQVGGYPAEAKASFGAESPAHSQASHGHEGR
jgi:CheY-like chemotaxis protein